MKNFLLLLGPSGVGKSTLIRLLQCLDVKFSYITPYITRVLRDKETEKISISIDEFNYLESQNFFLAVNELYGVKYGTPKSLIDEAFDKGNYPILDWPINRLHVMEPVYSERLFRVYIYPSSLEVLKKRLSVDSRDASGDRFIAARTEFIDFCSGKFNQFIDLFVNSVDGKQNETARYIYHAYCNQ